MYMYVAKENQGGAATKTTAATMMTLLLQSDSFDSHEGNDSLLPPIANDI